MIHFILSFVSVFITTRLVNVYYSDWLSLLIFTFLLTIVNYTVKPIITFLTFPISFLTLGIFYFILNVLFLMLVSHFTPGFLFTSFWQAAIFGFVLSIVEWFIFKFEI